MVKAVDTVADKLSDRVQDWRFSSPAAAPLRLEITHPPCVLLILDISSCICAYAVIGSMEPQTCRPECTREFCQANPSEICSARWLVAENVHLNASSCSFRKKSTTLHWLFDRSVSLQKSGCQDSCQHTSCSSCLLLKPPSCPQTCSDSDSACQRHFGRCVRSSLAAVHRDRSNPLCLNNLQVGGRKAPTPIVHSSRYTAVLILSYFSLTGQHGWTFPVFGSTMFKFFCIIPSETES